MLQPMPPVLSTEMAARAALERARWGGVPCCPHCGVRGRLYRCGVKQMSDSLETWHGVWKCGACRRKSTVTTGTVLARTKISLSEWMHAVEMYCRHPKGLSALDLLDHLAISRRTAYFMHSRIRNATMHPPLSAEIRKALRPGAIRAFAEQPRANGQRISLWPLSVETAMKALLAVRPYMA